MSEDDLHIIWKHLLFDPTDLKDTLGRSLQLIDQGEHNHTDGPDFAAGSIARGSVRLFGNIELHLDSRDWYHHGHHLDPAYNNVILHVTLKPLEKGEIKTESDETIPELDLSQVMDISAGLASDRTVPCGYTKPTVIRSDVLHRQAHDAYLGYLDKKVDQLMEFYPADKGIRSAIKQVLVLGTAHYCGRPHNEDTFREAALRAINIKTCFPRHKDDFSGYLRSRGVRPVLLSDARLNSVSELVELLHDWHPGASVDENLASLRQWKRSTESLPKIGRVTSSILYRCVYIPVMLLWGRLTANRRLAKKITECWLETHAPGVSSVHQKMPTWLKESAPVKRYPNFLLYQYKSYCASGRCDECRVMKMLTSA